ncbi:MAG: hypothetical protein ACREXS_10125 [Gammaproteobacteria bacterium]
MLFEPGKAVVGEAACLIASVVDVFPSEGRLVAVLDTTVAHLPEVFEYQTSPALREAIRGARYRYLIAGSSCLAGDLFGNYEFSEPLGVGDRLTFEGIGAYSVVNPNVAKNPVVRQLTQLSKPPGNATTPPGPLDWLTY